MPRGSNGESAGAVLPATGSSATRRFTNAAAAVLTEYRGLTVKNLQELRRSLGENATYAVTKNTLTTIAAREAGIEGLDDQPKAAAPSATTAPLPYPSKQQEAMA